MSHHQHGALCHSCLIWSWSSRLLCEMEFFYHHFACNLVWTLKVNKSPVFCTVMYRAVMKTKCKCWSTNKRDLILTRKSRVWGHVDGWGPRRPRRSVDEPIPPAAGNQVPCVTVTVSARPFGDKDLGLGQGLKKDLSTCPSPGTFVPSWQEARRYKGHLTRILIPALWPWNAPRPYSFLPPAWHFPSVSTRPRRSWSHQRQRWGNGGESGCTCRCHSSRGPGRGSARGARGARAAPQVSPLHPGLRSPALRPPLGSVVSPISPGAALASVPSYQGKNAWVFPLGINRGTDFHGPYHP